MAFRLCSAYFVFNYCCRFYNGNSSREEHRVDCTNDEEEWQKLESDYKQSEAGRLEK